MMKEPSRWKGRCISVPAILAACSKIHLIPHRITINAYHSYSISSFLHFRFNAHYDTDAGGNNQNSVFVRNEIVSMGVLFVVFLRIFVDKDMDCKMREIWRVDRRSAMFVMLICRYSYWNLFSNFITSAHKCSFLQSRLLLTQRSGITGFLTGSSHASAEIMLTIRMSLFHVNVPYNTIFIVTLWSKLSMTKLPRASTASLAPRRCSGPRPGQIFTCFIHINKIIEIGCDAPISLWAMPTWWAPWRQREFCAPLQ